LQAGALDRWIDAGVPGFLTSTSSPIPGGYDCLHISFYRWSREQDRTSMYLVVSGPPGGRYFANWEILALNWRNQALS